MCGDNDTVYDDDDLEFPPCNICGLYKAGTDYGDRNLLAMPFSRFLHGLDCYRERDEHDLFIQRWAWQRGLNPNRAIRVADRLRLRWLIRCHEESVIRRRRHREEQARRMLQLICTRNENRFLADAAERLGWALP
jgi:hypothetical protein